MTYKWKKMGYRPLSTNEQMAAQRCQTWSKRRPSGFRIPMAPNAAIFAIATYMVAMEWQVDKRMFSEAMEDAGIDPRMAEDLLVRQLRWCESKPSMRVTEDSIIDGNGWILGHVDFSEVAYIGGLIDHCYFADPTYLQSGCGDIGRLVKRLYRRGRVS